MKWLDEKRQRQRRIYQKKILKIIRNRKPEMPKDSQG